MSVPYCSYLATFHILVFTGSEWALSIPMLAWTYPFGIIDLRVQERKEGHYIILVLSGSVCVICPDW